MGEAVAGLARIADRLRAPDGCPWDREQTHATLRPNLLEEAYEALEAIDGGEPAVLRDELGDLLFQVVIHAQLAREGGQFDLGDVARRISEKLVRRHPHVFEGKRIEGDLLEQWERIKREEHAEAASASRIDGERATEQRSILDGIPVSLPSLFRAERLQERVERVGVEIPAIDLPIDIDDERFLGDLLFDLVAASRALGYDPETALREANERFAVHVRRMEERARAEGRELESYDPDEVRELWQTTA
jgi:tetrapyrrole methylase family protein/MazG family protein